MREIRSIGVAGRRVVLEWATDILANPRYTDASTYEDVLGEAALRHHPRGGFWNDHGHRAAYGITLEDVKRCKAQLGRIKITRTFDEVDAYLTEAVMCYDQFTMSQAPTTPAERKAAQRARARAEGRCIICCREAVTIGKSTCHGCGAKANAAKKGKAAAA